MRFRRFSIRILPFRISIRRRIRQRHRGNRRPLSIRERRVKIRLKPRIQRALIPRGIVFFVMERQAVQRIAAHQQRFPALHIQHLPRNRLTAVIKIAILLILPKNDRIADPRFFRVPRANPANERHQAHSKQLFHFPFPLRRFRFHYSTIQLKLVVDSHPILPQNKKSAATPLGNRGEEVEMRGVEPLSEGSLAGPSPSADCDLKFPHDDARSQASAIGSFMLRTHGKAYMRSFPA